jgi:hypothetical protein
MRQWRPQLLVAVQRWRHARAIRAHERELTKRTGIPIMYEFAVLLPNARLAFTGETQQ